MESSCGQVVVGVVIKEDKGHVTSTTSSLLYCLVLLNFTVLINSQ